MTEKSFNSENELKLKKHADKALAAAKENPVALEEGKRSRDQLYRWLLHLDAITKDPSEVVTPELAEAVHAEFTAESAKASDAKAAMLAALKSVFAKAFTMPQLMTRQSGLMMWEATGFYADDGIKTVFAKVGRHAYQPIGFDDGEIFVPLEVSKTLWSREFSLALSIPFPPAFAVSKGEDKADADFDSVRLTEEDVAKVTEIVGWFQEELQSYAKADTDEKRTEVRTRLVDTVKLARIRFSPLDKKMAAFTEQRLDMGANLENADIVQLSGAITDWLCLRLDENKVREAVVSSSLVLPDVGTSGGIITSVMSRLEKVIIPNKEGLIDGDTVASALTAVVQAYPPIRIILDDLKPETPVEEAARVVLVYLKDKLTTESKT